MNAADFVLAFAKGQRRKVGRELVVTAGMVGARLGPPRVMVACGALAACLPGLHLVGGRPLSEGLGAAWLMALLLLVLRLWSGDGRALWVGVWAGLLLGPG